MNKLGKNLHVRGRTIQALKLDMTAAMSALFDEQFDSAYFDEIEFYLEPDKIGIRWNGNNAEDYNKVIMFGGAGMALRVSHPLSIALRFIGVDVFTSGTELFRGVDKLTQNVNFVTQGVKIPKTFFGNAQTMIENAGDFVGFPMVVKDIMANRGERNYLVRNQSQLEEMRKELEEGRFIAQEFIPNNGDFRVLMSATDEVLVIKRQAQPGSHLNNTSQGGGAELIDNPPAELLAQAKQILQESGMPLLGIDAIEHNGAFYFLEINMQPQIFRGVFIEEKVALFKRTIDSL